MGTRDGKKQFALGLCSDWTLERLALGRNFRTAAQHSPGVFPLRKNEIVGVISPAKSLVFSAWLSILVT